jgi:hypothetical protein
MHLPLLLPISTSRYALPTSHCLFGGNLRGRLGGCLIIYARLKPCPTSLCPRWFSSVFICVHLAKLSHFFSCFLNFVLLPQVQYILFRVFVLSLFFPFLFRHTLCVACYSLFFYFRYARSNRPFVEKTRLGWTLRVASVVKDSFFCLRSQRFNFC